MEPGSADGIESDEDLDGFSDVNDTDPAVIGEGRVVGGSLSRRYEFPWHVSSTEVTNFWLLLSSI